LQEKRNSTGPQQGPASCQAGARAAPRQDGHTPAVSGPDRPASSLTERLLAFAGAGERRGRAQRLCLAALIVLAALAMRLVLPGEAPGSASVYLTFYPAVAVAAFAGGFAGGLLAVILSAVLAHAALASLETAADWLGLAAFLLSGSLISMLAAALHITIARLAISPAAQAHLQRINEQYQATLNCMADGVHVIDVQGRVILENPAAARMLGWDPVEMLGKPSHATIHHTHGDGAPYPREDCPIYLTFQDGVARHVFDEVFWRKDGTSFPVEYETAALRNAHGEILGTVMVFRDITGRKRAEAALRESEERLRLALAASRAGAWRWDLAREVISISDGCCDLYGLPSAAPLTPDTWLAQVHPDDRDRVRHEAEQAVRGGAEIRHEYRINHPERGERWIEVQGRVERDSEGRAIGVVGIDLDVTERKSLLEALASANADLERKVAERTAALALEMEGREEAQRLLGHAQRLEATGRLASGLAHDFNNTLAAIAAHLEFAMPRIGDAKARDSVKAALDAVELGGSLNRRLLSVAASRHNPPSIGAMGEPLRAVLALIGRTLGRDIVIATEIDPDLWPARFDPGELESAILNLAINARDAMPEGGRLTVGACNVTLQSNSLPAGSTASPGDFVCISLLDSGAGMTPEVKARASEPFFTTKSAAKGTGLGLSSVNEFVRSARGFMTIESAVGAGTEVALYLPRAAVPAVAPAVPAPGTSAVPMGDGELVLLIDDDERVLEATHRLLEGLGYAVVSAKSGPEAMAMLEQGEPAQVVLSDVIMPGGMSGFEVARRVRAEYPAVKILLASGHYDESLDCPGGMVILRKPYSRARIAEALEAALHGSGLPPSCSTLPANT
jgi:PAS domain S-box-containing protein